MKLEYFPDYTDLNEYQNMLYCEGKKNNFKILPLLNPFNISKDTDFVHFHWQNHLWDFVENPKEFVKNGFPGLFDYKKNTKKIKTIWTIHNTMPHETENLDIEIALMQKFSDESDIIHVLSKESFFEIKKYITIDEKKVICVKHSSYNNFFNVPNSNKNNKKDLGIPNNCYVIGSIGNIRPYKNIEFVLNSYLILRKKRNDIYCIIAGINQDNKACNKIKEIALKDKNLIFIEGILSKNQFSQLASVIDVSIYAYKNVLNSGSAYGSFTFGQHVILPNLPSLIGLNKFNFVSFFEQNSMESLVESIENVINKDLNRNFILKWSNKNTSNKMSNKFFKKILAK